MLWELLCSWFGLGSPKHASDEEDAARLRGDLLCLEQETAAIATTQRDCESALSALCEKESLLREGLEALLMELHDDEGAGGARTAESLESAAKATAGMWSVVESVQRRREELQARGYQLAVTLRGLEVEKSVLAQSLERIEAERHRASEECVDRVPGVTRCVIPEPPVRVLLLEEYRDHMRSQ